MVLDLRAQILCNLGPVISGSIRDDHIQGQGLIYTTGELVIAGLITPAHGSEVQLAYVTPAGDRVARFPRGRFRVTRAFANPLSNQTEITIANDLAFQKGKGGGTVNSALVDALNGRAPKVASVLDLREAFELLATRCGISYGDLGSWSLPKQIPALESPDYIETMSDILASVSRFGYLDADNVLQVQSYDGLSLGGPVITFDKVLDLNPNAGGLDFTEAPVGSGDAQAINGEQPSNVVYTRGVTVETGSYGRFEARWDNSFLQTTSEIDVTYYDQSQDTFAITEIVVSSERKAEPDDRVIENRSQKTEDLVKLNSQVVQDYINRGHQLIILGVEREDKELISIGRELQEKGRRIAFDRYTSRKTTRFIYEEIPPPSLTEEEQAQVDQEIESATNALANDATYGTANAAANESLKIILLPKLPTYRKIQEVTTETMTYVEALGRMGVPSFVNYGDLPAGDGIKEQIELTYLYTGTAIKEFKRVFVAYGLTQMGQQAIAAAAAAIEAETDRDFEPLLSQFFRLVLEDTVVTLRDDGSDNDPPKIPNYLAPYQHSELVIQGGNRIQVGDSPPARSNSATSFSVPFLPDDVVNDDGSVSKGNAQAAAAGFAEQQNLLLLGHRLGLQLTTGLGQLPSNPLAAFHLSSNGLTATYRNNGTSWAFDANSCIVSTDALYWGLAGGDINGPRWTPVAPGTTALPTPPAPVNNGPQDPANSIALEDPVDESDSSAIAALINSLPTDEAEVFEVEQTPEALAPAFKLTRETTLQVVLQLEPKLVPLGINRALGEVELQLRSQLEAVQSLEPEVHTLLESSEVQSLVESFSAILAIEATLS